MSNIELTSDNVNAIFEAAFISNLTTAKKHQPDENAIVIGGLTSHYCLSKSQLEAHRADIENWLTKIHPGFVRGAHFLSLNYLEDKETIWSDSQTTTERLMLLAMGINKMRYSITFRYLWRAFPQGLPYLKLI